MLGRDERYKDAGREGEQVTGGWEIPEVENGHAGEVAEGVRQSRNEVFTEIQFLQIQALTKAVGELFDLPHLKLLKLPTSMTLSAFQFPPILVSIPDTYPTKIRQTADPHSQKKPTFFGKKTSFFWKKDVFIRVWDLRFSKVVSFRCRASLSCLIHYLSYGHATQFRWMHYLFSFFPCKLLGPAPFRRPVCRV